MGQTSSVNKAINSDHVNGGDELPRDFLMNPDVWYSIFARGLRPLDLLNLARTCKYFRAILMTKSSVFVWENARRRVEGLPDCPPDLSEPAYADLAFCAHCHACGKHTSNVLWRIRRRYCSDCQAQCLCRGLSYLMIVHKGVLVAEDMGKKPSARFEKSQAASLVREYKRARDKKQFLSDRKKRCEAIYDHARQCASWQKKKEEMELLERQEKERACLRARHRSILGRLKQLGYEPEVNYFGEIYFQESGSKKLHTLTDQEWAQMLPGWLETMNEHRERRLNAVVYGPRRRLLESEYDIYVRSPDTPYFELLPHVDELSCFPPFRDVLRAPEGIPLDEKLFESAFVKLPGLVEEWNEQLDAEVAKLVTIPAHLSLQDTPSRQVMALTNRDKLRLACALFDWEGNQCFCHPKLFTMLEYSKPDGETTNWTESLRQIKLSEEAPYIVRACGLDPNVATWDDMSRRNARLKCLVCSGNRVMWWFGAALHASNNHRSLQPGSRSRSPRWELISDRHLPAIEAAERSVREDVAVQKLRCLLCLSRVGDSMVRTELVDHLRRSHGVMSNHMECNIHYEPWSFSHPSSWVEMVENAGRISFRGHHR